MKQNLNYHRQKIVLLTIALVALSSVSYSTIGPWKGCTFIGLQGFQTQTNPLNGNMTYCPENYYWVFDNWNNATVQDQLKKTFAAYRAAKINIVRILISPQMPGAGYTDSYINANTYPSNISPDYPTPQQTRINQVKQFINFAYDNYGISTDIMFCAPKDLKNNPSNFICRSDFSNDDKWIYTWLTALQDASVLNKIGVFELALELVLGYYGDNNTYNWQTTVQAVPTGTGYTINDLNFVYSPGWTYTIDPLDYSSDEHFSNVPNASVTITFTGTKIQLFGRTDPSFGAFYPSIDNTQPMNGNSLLQWPTSIAPFNHKQLLFQSVDLHHGVHTLKITNAQAKTIAVDYAVISDDQPIVENHYNWIKHMWGYVKTNFGALLNAKKVTFNILGIKGQDPLGNGFSLYPGTGITKSKMSTMQIFLTNATYGFPGIANASTELYMENNAQFPAGTTPWQTYRDSAISLLNAYYNSGTALPLFISEWGMHTVPSGDVPGPYTEPDQSEYFHGIFEGAASITGNVSLQFWSGSDDYPGVGSGLFRDYDANNNPILQPAWYWVMNYFNPNNSVRDLAIGKNGAVFNIGYGWGNLDNYKLNQLSGLDWSQFKNTSAIKVTVDQMGYPWMINNTGKIYGISHWNGSNDSWVSISTRNAYELSMAGNGWLNMLGDPGVSANWAVWRWNGTWAQYGGNPVASKIASDPNGNPWIIDFNKKIARWTGLVWDNTFTSWKATDIAIGPYIGSDSKPVAYILGTDIGPDGGYSLYRWFDNYGWVTTNAPGGGVTIGGTGIKVAVDQNGYPWVIKANNSIWKWVGSTWTLVTQKLWGTPFGTSPAYNNGTSTFDKASDGNTATYVDYQSADNGYTGIDLGAGNASTVSKIRYYPRDNYNGRMAGGKFQGSNTSATSGYTDLATISGTPTAKQWSELSVSTTAYRYLRYLSPTGSHGNIAEMEFYSGTFQ